MSRQAINFLTLLIFSQICGTISTAFAARNKPNVEAITGDSTYEDKSAWEAYYRRKLNDDHLPPVEIIKEFSVKLPKGAKIFCPAMGEGRNALFLAKRGFDVTGNDISESAVQKVRADANHKKIQLKTIIGDLTQMNIPNNSYDAIVLSYFYMGELVPKWKTALKKGGVIIAQQRLLGQTSRETGVPSEFNVQAGEIETAFSGWKVLSKQEIKSKIGTSIALVLQKP